MDRALGYEPRLVGGSNPLNSTNSKKEIMTMTKEDKLAIMKDRYRRLSCSPKNIKSRGVIQKLARQIRNLEKEN